LSAILDFLKANSRLSSLPFILAMFGVGVVLLHARRTARIGRIWLTAVCLLFWLAWTPLGSSSIAWPIATSDPPIQSPADARGATAVVMLGGGTISHVAYGIGVDDLAGSALRIIETVRVYRLLNDPLVIVSGGDTQRLDPPRTEASAYREAAIRVGIPADRIVMEDRSRTTREEALLLKPRLAGRGIGRFVLVTAPTHMKRAVRALRAVGLDPVPSPTPLRGTEGSERRSWWSLMPDHESLAVSDDAIYDMLATLYYRLRGWL